MSIISDRRKAIAQRLRERVQPIPAKPRRTAPAEYTNDRRAGRTHPEKREVRDRQHPLYNMQAGPGYMIKANERHPMNRNDRRRQGQIRPKQKRLRKSRALYPSIVTAEDSHKRLMKALLPTANERKARSI